jgi:inward rectifier potassium channel
MNTSSHELSVSHVPTATLPADARSLGNGLYSVGQTESRWRDLYHGLLSMTWPRFLALVVGSYVAANLMFASLYTMLPDAIGNSHGFVDNFFFSVQTWATIGYGGMVPQTRAANVVVVVESLVGIFAVALLTGLMFAKFSKSIVVMRMHNQDVLAIRIANERGSAIVRARAELTLIFDEVTPEGERLRRLTDLKLVRQHTPLFRVSWMLMHIIDESSPLWGVDKKTFSKSTARFILNIDGFDSTVAQTAHAGTLYEASQVLFDHRYIDASTITDKGTVLDYQKLSLVAPLPAGPLTERATVGPSAP